MLTSDMTNRSLNFLFLTLIYADFYDLFFLYLRSNIINDQKENKKSPKEYLRIILKIKI